MVKEAEAACDDVVVMSSRQSKTYANCLMRILEHAAGIKRRSSFVSLWTGLAAGGTVTGNRIRKLLQHSRIISTNITPTALIALLLVAALGLPSVFGGTSKKDVPTESVAIPQQSLEEDKPGAVIWGRGKKIEGKVHISNISYSGGNFWALGIPAHLEEWMNARSKVHVNLITHEGKMVYLSWPPEDASSEQIKDVSEYVDPDGLFKQPMLLWSSIREVNLSQAEKENLRKYLVEKQGFLFIDGNSSDDASEFLTSIRSNLRDILPQFPITRIPNNHEIYSIFYEMGGPPLGPTSQRAMEDGNYLEGIFINEELAVVISDRNYWNALIGREPYSPGVMRFCTNMVVYAVTHGGIVDYSQYKPFKEENLRVKVVTDDANTPQIVIGKDGAEMALIPAGEFQMGDHFNEGGDDELPVHTVYLDAFLIDKREVPNAQYAKFLNEYGKNTDAAGHTLLDIADSHCLIERVGNIYKPKAGCESHPVIEVSWYGAAAYAQFYGKRLPTEAEWEKAARGRLVGNRYPWGDDISHDDANYLGTGGRDKWDRTSPVGSFPPNGYGLYDVAGNVWEWCSDEYDFLGYYSRSEENNPKGPGTFVKFKNDAFTNVASRRVLRGGLWDNSPHYLRCANRHNYDPSRTVSYAGFRCASVHEVTVRRQDL